jgi:4-deoxy-L-threo-5-hexosulose-uronate ketol-isomerase
MSTHTSIRYALHPDHVKQLSSRELREHFLIESLFVDNQIQLVYSHYDRLIAGGCKASAQPLFLETIPSLKSTYFLERREIGIINVGGTGIVTADEKTFTLQHKEALYIGKGTKQVSFAGIGSTPALFYFNAAPAHHAYPTRHITLTDAETVQLGSSENANQRTIRKLLVNSVLETCQLQMGLTELAPGSVWNTMPPHTHDRRMEVYFYFNISEGNTVSHFMGEPTESRHLWIQNHQAVISPPWSLHCGAGTSHYSFIWGMAGENMDYGDMDAVKLADLR